MTRGSRTDKQPSRRRAEREARRRFIVEAARRLFAKASISSVNMDDIAAASQYTRRTIYAYFKSRDDILLRILLEDMTRRLALQKMAETGVVGGMARIMVWAETQYAFWKENPQAVEVERYWDFQGIDRTRVSADVFDEFKKVNNEFAAALREMFREGIDDGSLRADLAVEASVSQFVYAFRAILGRALSSSYSFTDVDPDQYVQLYLDQYRRSICSEKRRVGS